MSTMQSMKCEARKITIIPTDHLKEAKGVEEDWTGKSSRERRKLQNRLHQRAYRRRKALLAASSVTPFQHHTATTGVTQDALSSAFAAATNAFLQPTLALQYCRTTTAPQTFPTARTPHPRAPKKPLLIPPLISYYTQPKSVPCTRDVNGFSPSINSTSNSPSATTAEPYFQIIFPLSPDHHLITLIQYNTMRALTTNFAITGNLATLRVECTAMVQLPPLTNLPATTPPSFAPTALQMSVRHNAWIDSVPCPRMRDNLILATTAVESPSPPLSFMPTSTAASTSTVPPSAPSASAQDSLPGVLDEDEFCTDICGGLYEGFDDCAARGVLIWGDPWEVANWEVSEGFWRKWGWLLEGCDEMIEATNRWRLGRGEEVLGQGFVIGEA